MALMKHVAVCSPDISKLIYQISCRLGSIGFSKMIEQKYGILSECSQEEYMELKLYLEVFKKLQKIEVTDDNLDLSNIIKDLQLLNNCEIKECNITNVIEKVKDLLQTCSDCDTYTPSVLYTTNDEWFSTQEYVECLQNEFENNGYIEYLNPIISLCDNLNIDINATKLCQELVIVLNANKISCELVSSINATNICNLIQMDNLLNIDITASTLCTLVLKDIKGELPRCDIDINISTNEVNGCNYTPVCDTELPCETPLLTITDNTCECIDNVMVNTPGVVEIATDCADDLLYSVNGSTWSNVLPDYEDIDNALYYKCVCENSIHVVFKHEEICNTFVNLYRLCRYEYEGSYVTTYNISGNIDNLMLDSITVVPVDADVHYFIAQGSIVFYQSVGSNIATQITIPVVCSYPSILLDIFEPDSNPNGLFPDGEVTYDCETHEMNITAPVDYNVSSNLINWENNIVIISDTFPIKYFIRDVNNIECIQIKEYTPDCCYVHGCADVYITIDNALKDYTIINPNNCEYIIDFYVDYVKVHTEGYGSIYDASFENPNNLTLKNILNSYCGDLEHPALIYPVIRQLKCQNLVCNPLCALPVIENRCLNICALPLVSAPTFYYETTNNMESQNINYAISGNTTLSITYNMYVVSDSIEVWYNGFLVAGFYDLVGIQNYEVPISHLLGIDMVTIKFIPNQLLPTKADITVGCLGEYTCEPKLECLTLNTLDYENPVISVNTYPCNSILTVTLPITSAGNYVYRDCDDIFYTSVQTNSVNFNIVNNVECAINRLNTVYLCNITNFEDGSVILTNNNSSRTLFVSDTVLYTAIKNYINGYSCNVNNQFNSIEINLVNTESTACNTDCVDDIHCNIYTTYPIYIYLCNSIVSFNDSINTITITNGELPTLSGSSCDCGFNQIAELLQKTNYGTDILYFKTVDKLSYIEVLGQLATNVKYRYIFNSTAYNAEIEGCEVETESYYIVYLCEDNSQNSVRIYRTDNNHVGLYALVYQGVITWTDGRVVNSSNYIYTSTQIQTNTGNC